jgi:hypothetical protein
MMKIEVPEVLPRSEYLRLPPSERELYVREILRKAVRKNLQGVTVSLLAEKLPFDPRTIEKHLSILTYTNEIYSVKIGNTQLYLPNSIPMHPAEQRSLDTVSREYTAYILQNRLGEFVFVQEKKKEESSEVGGGILIPLGDFDRFVDFLDSLRKSINKSKGSG